MLKLALAGAMALAFSPQPVGTSISFALHPYIKQIRCDKGLGTGFRLKDGRWVSANHVTTLGNCQIDGKPITVTFADERKDYSIFTVKSDVVGGLNLDCSGYRQREWYYGQGHAGGLSFQTIVPVMAYKLFSRPHPRDWSVLVYNKFIPGQSGGAVLDSWGNAVGIVNAYGVYQPISFSIALKDTVLCQG